MTTSRRPIPILQRQLAEQLVSARLQAVTLTAFDEVDLTALTALLDEVQAAFSAKYAVALSHLPFFIKATVAALKQVPPLRCRIDGEDLVESDRYDLAVTLTTPAGAIAPVLRDCEAKSIAALELELADLTTKARAGDLTIPDLQGGVLTLANATGPGILFGTPALNQPQSAVLGLHAIHHRPVAREGRVLPCPMMYLALGYDARIIDSATAAAFLSHLKSALETPVGLLLTP